MDIGSLANFISNCNKLDFDIACKVLLLDGLNLDAINVDGSNDGGADFVEFDKDGQRKKVAYQLTTQKTDIKRKAYKDAKKSIVKLGVNTYYFLCSYNLNEIESRELEEQISNDLNIRAIVYSPAIIAGRMIKLNIVGEFLDRIGYDELRTYDKKGIGYREMALHNYSLLSKDAKNLKSLVYDDALLLVLANATSNMTIESVALESIELLSLPESKLEFLVRRVDSLLSRGQIKKSKLGDDFIELSDDVKQDIKNRRILYNKELDILLASQVDILKEYNISWTRDDSQQAAVWISNSFMKDQIHTLEIADATLADNFNRHIDKNGYQKLISYLKDTKLVDKETADIIAGKLLNNASSQPLITKITSATVYLALEGGNPLTACRALGVSKWSNVNMLLEPTLGIPYVCSLLYKGSVNRFFDNAITTIKRCKKLGIRVSIPHYYIRECAGHLHMARKFDGLELDPKEMQYSNNAFVSNYYALKNQNIELPESFMDYLATFSPAIRTERSEYKEWIRAIMNDISSLLTRNGIEFQEMPLFPPEDLKPIEMEYSRYLERKGKKKLPHLIANDVISLVYTNKCHDRNSESWMILTYDKSLIDVASTTCSAWVNTPFVFLNLTEMAKDITDMKLSTIVHNMAANSSNALVVGARIWDRIILYSSDKVQDWQFKRAIEEFKNEMISSSFNTEDDYMDVLDRKTDEFLEKHGVNINFEDENNDVDMNTENS